MVYPDYHVHPVGSFRVNWLKLLRPADLYRIRIAMFVDGVEQGVRSFGAVLIVGKHVGRIHRVDRHKDQVAILAHVGLDEIAPVVVFGHLDPIPGDGDFIAIAHGIDIRWRGIEGGMRQGPMGNRQAHNITTLFHVQDREGGETVPPTFVRLDPDPGAIVIAAPGDARIPGVEALRVQVGFTRPVAAVGLLLYGDQR